MIPFACYTPADKLKKMEPRDALAYANLVEGRLYSDRTLLWLLDNLKPESFHWVDIKPIILKEELHPGELAQIRLSYLNRVTGRITIKYLEEGKGGKFRRLRYFTSIIRRLALAANFSSSSLGNCATTTQPTPSQATRYL